MSNENHSQFEDFLAQAAEPEELEGSQNEQLNDPGQSLKTGLEKLYNKYLQQIKKQLADGLINENKAQELIAYTDRLSLADLGYETSKCTSIERAREIMDDNSFFGPEEVKKAFGIEITEHIPPIPFSPEELERAKLLGQFLVFRVNKTADGQPLTMEKIEQLVQPEFDREDKGKVLYPRDWYKTESFFTSQTPNMGWALTTRETIPGSLDENYLEQMETLVDYLKNQVFAGSRLPSEYSDAIVQFEAIKDETRLLIKSDWQAAAQKLIGLEINQLTRQSPVEVLYDGLIYFQNTNERILETVFTWTNARDSADLLVRLGDTDSNGVDINWEAASTTRLYLGVSFSRRGADLKS